MLSMCWYFRAVTDPRDRKRVALKKMPNVFQNLISCKRVYRELRMLATFKHQNVSAASVTLQALSRGEDSHKACNLFDN